MLRLKRLTILVCFLATPLFTGCGSSKDDEAPKCTTSSDCVALDSDSNHCNGGFACVEGRCVGDGEPLECPASETPCQDNVCEPDTGQCLPTASADSTACDTDKCLTNMVCQSGECQAGTPKCEDDGNPCTETLCNPNSGVCGHKPIADFDSCDDGNACTNDDVCVGGSCAGVPVKCKASDAACQTSTCDPETGECALADAQDNSPCDNNDPCTEKDVCKAGECIDGTPKCTEASGPCMVATCDSATGACNEIPANDGGDCDDNSLCTTEDRCEQGECTGTIVECPDSASPCSTIQCNPQNGQCDEKPALGQPSCDDDNKCTINDLCINGECLGTPKQCEEDDNACTYSACLDDQCISIAHNDGLECNDDDPCTVDDQCVNGECSAGTPKCPEDDNPCSVISCNGDTGDCSSSFLTNGSACGAADPCTDGATCQNGNCVGGAPKICPDDGNPCTLEPCVSKEGGCLSVELPENALCEDDDPCSEGESCVQGQCTGGSPTICPSPSSCTLSYCDPTLGCINVPLLDGDSCSDGNACTGNDECLDGVCKGEPLTCTASNSCMIAQCNEDIGCTEIPQINGQSCNDGNACTSSTVCKDGQCTAGAIVECESPNVQCLAGICDPATGLCGVGPAPEGTPCDDGNVCTTIDTCAATECIGGGPSACGDSQNPCVALECNPADGSCSAATLADGTECDANNLCTNTGICTNGTCSSEPTVNCPDPTQPCRVSLCDPSTGECSEAIAPDLAVCSDGEPCTANDTCIDGNCKSGVPVTCQDDGNSCTLESCQQGVGCESTELVDGTPCDDGNACTGNSLCANAECTGGQPIVCPSDGDPCTLDSCNEKQGCVYPASADGEQCDDGSLCTGPDTCKNGVCNGPEKISCDAPDDPCLASVCDADTGQCKTVPLPNDTVCDDKNACTSIDMCSNGVCIGVAKTCDQPGNPCQLATCDPAGGGCVILNAEENTPCNDNLLCTENDVCDGKGLCKGIAPNCPEPNEVCREASCDAITGECIVVVSNDGQPCEDGDLCSTGDYCLKGECEAGGAPACVPSHPCKAVSCDPKTAACVESDLVDNSPCNDGNACTFNTLCIAGECTGGEATQCTQDTNTCSNSVCNSQTGLCETLPLDNGTQCNDDDKCTDVDSCTNGVCAGVAHNCPDSTIPCKTNECSPEDGKCVAVDMADNSPCDDDNQCTHTDQCNLGVCQGSNVECPSPTTDCQDSVCSPEQGCVLEIANEGGTCADNACFLNTTCSQGVCTGGNEITCSPSNNPCEEAYCSLILGCTVTPLSDGTNCDDGNQCTSNTLCQGGQCLGESTQCPEPKVCYAAFCDPISGCGNQMLADGTNCNDNNPCTLNDVCQQGECTGGTPKECAGSTPCHPETCSPDNGGCVASVDPDGTLCDDGNGCTSNTTCNAGTCQGGTTLSCPQPEDACMVALCVAETGLCEQYPIADGTTCDDKNKCTTNDLCKSGTCMGDPSVVCGEPDSCLIQQCEPETGECFASMSNDGALCSDNNACTAGESCLNGVCQVGIATSSCCSSANDCDDGLVCTTDSCTNGQCTHAPANLPACVGRLVVAANKELYVFDAKTLKPTLASPITMPGTVRQLVAANDQGVILAAMADGTAFTVAIDPLASTQTPPNPKVTTLVSHMTVDSALGLVATLHPSGVVGLYDIHTGDSLGNPFLLGSALGLAALDQANHRLYVPSRLGFVDVISLQSPAQLIPNTPWLVGGNPTAAAYSASSDRLFLADAQANAVRVIDANYGTAAPGDPLGTAGTLISVQVSTAANRVYAAYKTTGEIAHYNLSTLLAADPASVTVEGGIDHMSHDPRLRALIALSAQSTAVHVLDDTTLAPVGSSPLSLPNTGSSAALMWSQPGTVVVNEALVNPSNTSDANGEWIEVHNPGDVAVDINGWSLQVGTKTHVIDNGAPLPIAGGGYALLCRNGDPQANGNLPCSYVYGFVPLSNDGIVITLSDKNGQIVDVATLNAPIPNGKSLALKHPAYNNQRGYSWAPSTSTPKSANLDVLDTL